MLIIGPNGGVGSFAVQIARAAGKRVIPVGRGDSLVEADALIDLVSADRSSFESKRALRAVGLQHQLRLQ